MRRTRRRPHRWSRVAATALAWLAVAGAAVPGPRAALAETDRPLGAHLGETVDFPSDPAVGAPVVPCTLAGGGPTLLFSNDPERVTGPGILYEDYVDGAVRVFLSHVNASSQVLHFGVLLTNLNAAPVTYYVTQQGVSGGTADYLAVGKLAEHLWFLGIAGYAHTLLPHHSYFLDPEFADHAIAPGGAVAGVFDLQTTARLKVDVVAESALSLSLQGLTVLASAQAAERQPPMRGTFAGADLTCSATMALPASGKAVLPLGTPEGYLAGRSAVDGGAEVVDRGNYGVLYQVQVTLTDSVDSPWTEYDLLLDTRGNTFAGMARLTAATGTSAPTGALIALPADRPYVRHVTQAVMLGMYRLYPLVTTQVDLDWMPAASSTLPAEVLVYPAF